MFGKPLKAAAQSNVPTKLRALEHRISNKILHQNRQIHQVTDQLSNLRKETGAAIDAQNRVITTHIDHSKDLLKTFRHSLISFNESIHATADQIETIESRQHTLTAEQKKNFALLNQKVEQLATKSGTTNLPAELLQQLKISQNQMKQLTAANQSTEERIRNIESSKSALPEDFKKELKLIREEQTKNTQALKEQLDTLQTTYNRQFSNLKQRFITQEQLDAALVDHLSATAEGSKPHTHDDLLGYIHTIQQAHSTHTSKLDTINQQHQQLNTQVSSLSNILDQIRTTTPGTAQAEQQPSHTSYEKLQQEINQIQRKLSEIPTHDDNHALTKRIAQLEAGSPMDSVANGVKQQNTQVTASQNEFFVSIPVVNDVKQQGTQINRLSMRIEDLWNDNTKIKRFIDEIIEEQRQTSGVVGMLEKTVLGESTTQKSVTSAENRLNVLTFKDS